MSKGHNENTYLSSLLIFDSIVIILFLPFVEYIFYGATLGYKKDESPWFINCISRRFLPLRVLQSNLLAGHMKICDYFSIDSVMKRMYWGLSFAITGVVASLVVEFLQIHSHKTDVTCLINSSNPNVTKQKYVSDLSIFSQVPQYILIAMFESVTIVGSYQFILYQCNKHFGSSLKGFFFGLHFTYLSLSQTFFAGIFWLIGSFCEEKDCKHCYVHNGKCHNYKNLKKTWVMWAVLLGALIIVFVVYSIVLHYRHCKMLRARNQFQLVIRGERQYLTRNLTVPPD